MIQGDTHDGKIPSAKPEKYVWLRVGTRPPFPPFYGSDTGFKVLVGPIKSRIGTFLSVDIHPLTGSERFQVLDFYHPIVLFDDDQISMVGVKTPVSV